MLQFSPCAIDLCIDKSQNLKVLVKKKEVKREKKCSVIHYIKYNIRITIFLWYRIYVTVFKKSKT